jgi:regulatory protein
MEDEQSPTRPVRRRERREPPPLQEAALRDLALAYAARYATTRMRLLRYLSRKLQERGWTGDAPPDPEALADRLVALRYVDDAAFASMKGRAMAARGLGRRRVEAALAAAGVSTDDRGEAPDAAAALATAIAFARRKRLGPFARAVSDDPALRKKAMAAMLRAGHGLDAARRVLAARSPGEAEALLEGV